MENETRIAAERDIAARPAAQGRKRFEAGKKEQALALASYAFAYLLAAFLWYGPEKTAALYPAAGAAFTAWVLASFPARGRAKEHWLWLAGVWAVIAEEMSRAGVIPCTLGRVWAGSPLPAAVFLPLLSGHWALACSGKAAGGKFGAGPVRDAVRVYVTVPIENMFARLDSVCAFARGARRKDGKKGRAGASLAACGIALLFFAAALALLRSADSGFDSAVSRLARALLPDLGPDIVPGFCVRLAVSVPIGAYLFAQIAGLARKDAGEIREEDARAEAALRRLRRVGAGLWTAILACFVLLYASFLAVQGSELIGAYRANWAPGTLTMAQFAKQGFFEMCAVMALNFALLYTAEKTDAAPLSAKKAGRALLSAVLGCSLLYAFSAVVKLAMYLRSFGYTPLRWQGAWGIAVLTAGCACALVTVWKGKNTMRAWTLFTAATLVLTLVV